MAIQVLTHELVCQVHLCHVTIIIQQLLKFISYLFTLDALATTITKALQQE
jgi:hypothetical protein